MAKRQKAKRFSIQAYDNKHYQSTEQYTRAVDALFDAATKAIAEEAVKGTYDPDKPFNFTEHPKVQSVMQNVTTQLASRLTTVIESGSKKQWLFACEKNDGFIASIMDTSKLSKARLKKMQDRNLDALQAFQERKVDGMNLSQRVWKYVGQYKEQIENALDVGLGEGLSAQQLARDVKQNLQEPNRLFRRVRDKRGNLVLSKNAKAYHPGRGVYRSSVKNAQRLTRSEINMAYRESDWQRWQTLDFVVGFEILRSNHDPLCDCDLCERLKGVYPKTFKFKGWHPQCMCYAIPILADEETFDENELGDLKAALHGTTYEHKAAKNTVVDVPQAFKDWVDEHKEAQANWGSTPYFIKDNFKNGVLSDGLKFEPIKVAQQIEQAVEVTHVPLSEKSEEEVKIERARWQALMNELEEMDDALREYGIPFDKAEDLIYNVIWGMRKDAEYWRYDEAKAEIERLKRELTSTVADYKQKALAAIETFWNNAMDASAWIDCTKAVSTRANFMQFFKEEEAKKYGSFKSFTTSSLLNHDFSPEVAAMKAKWEKAKQDANANIANPGGKDVSKLKELVSKTPGRNYAAFEIVKDIEDAIKVLNSGESFAQNMKDVETAIGVKCGTPMTFDEANQHKANLSYNMAFKDTLKESPYPEKEIKKHPYYINCQSCVVAHELRRRGFNVEAMPNWDKMETKPTQLSYDVNLIWIDPATGKHPVLNKWNAFSAGFTRTSKKAKQAAYDFYIDAMKEPGRYSLRYSWKVGKETGGHIITAERLADGTLRVYDPQNGQIRNLRDICEVINFTQWYPIGVQRVDNLMVDTSMIDGIVRKKK